MRINFCKSIWKNKIAKYMLFVALFLILLISADTYVFWHHTSKMYRQDLKNLKNCIKDFMITSNGIFPKSEDELIETGVLFKRKHIALTDRYQYYYCPDIVKNAKSRQHFFENEEVDIDHCIQLRYFEQFTILYGITLEDIELIDSKLHKKSNGNEVLLISRPNSLLLRKKHCKKASLELFKIMREKN